jgi:Mrp family chromosome partitioning ATPase
MNKDIAVGVGLGLSLAVSYELLRQVNWSELVEALMPIRNTDVPVDANEECPGVNSKNAGKSSSCEGCPNQAKCASGEAAAPDPAVEIVASRLKNVKHKILVLSGKGGVGKSTVSAQLTFGLAAQDLDNHVGLLDVDICGPSIPRMLGVTGRDIHQSADGWTPVFVDEQISVMSVGFMLPEEDSAVIWRGPKKHALIKQFLADVNWGELDYLICDTPPGTSDEHLSVVTLLKQAGIDGAILVTTPQEVSLQDVRKEISFCRKAGIPIIGLIENMSGFVCPTCSACTDVFTPTTGGSEAMCARLGIEFLGKLPLSSSVTQAGDKGSSVVTNIPQLRAVVDRVREITQKTINL